MTALRRALLAAFVLGLGSSITLSQTALAVLTLLWLWRLRAPGSRCAASWPLLGPMLTFSGVTVLAALASPQPWTGLLASKGLLLAAALYVTLDALADTQQAEWFLSGLVLICAVSALIGVGQVLLCPGTDPTVRFPTWPYHPCYRARGPFSIYMTLAGVLNLVLLASLPRLLPGSVRPRWFPPLWVTMLAGLVATYTRGAWIGFVAGVLSLLPTTRRGRLLLLAGLLGLGLAVLMGPAALRQRLLSIGDPHEPTTKERIYMWRTGASMWREHPWLGIGPGGVKREYRYHALPEAVKKRTGHVHNTPLQILVERGVAGLLSWLWIWVAFYRCVIGLLRRLPAGAARERALVAGSLAAVTGFLVGGLSEYNFGDSEVVMIAWSVMALPFVVERARQPGADAPPGV